MTKKSSGIIADSRLKRFVEIYEWKSDIHSVYLKDIDETFWFENKSAAQEFLNQQTSERFYDKKLRKGYFEYMNEHNEIMKYAILNINRGAITEFNCNIIMKP